MKCEKCKKECQKYEEHKYRCEDCKFIFDARYQYSINPLPVPLTKQDPIRWDFSQKEIEYKMDLIQRSINRFELDGEPELAKEWQNIKDDYQRKINWCIEARLWKLK